jgi:toxin HigB-1
MIRSFRDDATKLAFEGKCPKGFPVEIFKVARRKLAAVEAAARLEEPGSPPGNKLHALTNDRQGEHAIRINEKYRICFVWTAAGPANVEIVDHH